MLTACLLIAVIGYVYSVICTEPGMIFNKLFNYCERHLPAWLFNPLIGCVYCVTGQIALWYYLFAYWHSYNILHHVAFVCGAIFTVEAIITIKNRIDR